MSGERAEITACGTAPQVAASEPRRSRIGRYLVEGVLGSGGMGIVYLARDPALDRNVAIKIMAGDDEYAASRLIREGQAIAQISHPNVIHVYEVGREGSGGVYVAMERVDGLTLAAWLATPRSHAEIVRVFADAARGLAAAHAAGIVHRDFKPENVMIDRAGRARVLDFGLARSEGGPDHESGTVTSGAGTPAYMSPEQWRGERPGSASDQFSFCVALARALLGEPPFGRGTRDELRAAVLSGTTLPLRGVPRRLRAILRRGLRIDPDERYPSMDAVVAALSQGRRTVVAAGVIACAAVVTVVALRPEAATPRTRAFSTPTALTSRGDVLAAAVSPDQRLLAVVTASEVLVQAPVPAAEARVVARGRFANHTFAWDAAGARLAVFGSIADEPPGLILVDVAAARARRITQHIGMVALLDAPGGERDELVAARFSSTALRFYAIADPRAPLRICPLPQPFVGVRALRRTGRGVMVTLDRSDSDTVLVHVGRDCTIEDITRPVRALDYVVGTGDRMFARGLGANDLRELAGGELTGARWVLQSPEYTPIAVTATDDVIHIDRATRWQVIAIRDGGAPRDMLGGTGLGRFALAPDGTTLAHVDGVYQNGAVRVRDLHGGSTTSEAIAVGASRAAWSPDGRRLAILSNDRSAGYTIAVWDRERRTLSPSRPVAIRYESEMAWIDDRRVAFTVPHEYRSFAWIDPDTGESGSLAFVKDLMFSLSRAHGDDRLVFVTETDTEFVPWVVERGVARRVGAVTVRSPRSSRLPRVAWSADDRALLVYDGASGELWSVAVDGGTATPRPDLPMPRTGSGELAIADTARGLVVFAVAHIADVYTSEPLD